MRRGTVPLQTVLPTIKWPTLYDFVHFHYTPPITDGSGNEQERAEGISDRKMGTERSGNGGNGAGKRGNFDHGLQDSTDAGTEFLIGRERGGEVSQKLTEATKRESEVRSMRYEV